MRKILAAVLAAAIALSGTVFAAGGRGENVSAA